MKGRMTSLGCSGYALGACGWQAHSVRPDFLIEIKSGIHAPPDTVDSRCSDRPGGSPSTPEDKERYDSHEI
jgi:hypothetical protein